MTGSGSYYLAMLQQRGYGLDEHEGGARGRGGVSPSLREDVVVRTPDGLHGRPSALIYKRLRPLQGRVGFEVMERVL